MAKKSQSNQAADVRNSNNAAFHANNGNRGGQLNPQHPNYGGQQSGGQSGTTK